MDIAVNPTLFIALGGTGRNVLERYRRRLRQRVGTDQMPFLEYLYVDTDQDNGQTSGDDGVGIGLPPTTGQQVADLRGSLAEQLRLGEWVHDGVLELLKKGTVNGAGGNRQLGHISFLVSPELRRLQDRIQTKVASLRTARSGGLPRELTNVYPAYLRVAVQGVGPQISIIVVASAGGGTGSSTFIDMGYFVRRALMLQSVDEELYRTIAIVSVASTALPDSDRRRTNSAGVLTELNHYLSRHGNYSAAYPLAFPAAPLDRSRMNRENPLYHLPERPPYDAHYLVQPATYHSGHLHPADPAVSMNRQEQKIAEMLLAETVYAARDRGMATRLEGGTPKKAPAVERVERSELKSRSIDLAATVDLARYDEVYPTSYLTFGVAVREFPPAMHHILAYGQAVRTLARDWTTLPEAADGDDLKQPAANDLLAGWARRLGLAADEGLLADSGYAVRADDDPLLQALLEPTARGFDPRRALDEAATPQRAGYGSASEAQNWLASVGNQCAALCRPVQAREPEPYAEGSVFAAVRNQRDRLAGWDDRGLPGALAMALLGLAFDPNAGPAAALRVVSRLTARLAAEVAHVQHCREKVPSPPPVSGLQTSARPTQRDWLLWPHRLAAPGVDPGPWRCQAWEVANSALLKLVLEARLAVLQAVETACTQMQPRLQYLTSWFQAWAAAAPRDDAPEHVLTDEEQRSVLRRDDLVRRFADLGPVRPQLGQQLRETQLYQDLTRLVRQGLPDTVDGQPTLLARDVPRQHDGRTVDLAPLQEVERSLFESIGSRADGPYDQQVDELLLHSGLTPEKLAAQLHEESSPLLQFDHNNPLFKNTTMFPAQIEQWFYLADPGCRQYGHLASELERQAISSYRFTDPSPAAFRLPQQADGIGTMLAIERHRTGIPTALINGYDTNAVLRLIDQAASPPVTDQRIRPPVGPLLLREACRMILGGLVLGNEVIFTLGKQSGFRFTWAERQASGFTKENPVDLPADLVAAATRLAQSDRDRRELDLKIRGHLLNHADAATVRLHEVYARANQLHNSRPAGSEQRQFDVWEEGGRPSGVCIENVSFEEAMTFLMSFVQHYRLPVMPSEEGNIRFYRQGEDLPAGGRAQVDGWHCKFDGERIGNDHPAPGTYCPRCLGSNSGATAR
ncbi:MAG: hypothetical protein IT204_17215 [Fimbriimonadaceae bacterium]|nr:hypothetical protein [Fimbriimonadaceae bacterium]